MEESCGPQWYGWNENSDVGSISTTLYKSSKCGKLYFGNCGEDGLVVVYLAGKNIGESGSYIGINRIIEFAIPEDSLLEIKAEGEKTVIKFTYFEMVNCSSKCKLFSSWG